MSDWETACDPVPARRELTDAEKKRLQALFELRRLQGFARLRSSVRGGAAYRVDSDFEEMGA